jgi:sodium-dependent dicarboxylate transporter 2/3/5
MLAWLAQRTERFGFRQKAGLVLGPLLSLLTGGGLGIAGLQPVACWTAATVVLMSILWVTEPVPLWVTACVPLVFYPALGTAPWHEVALHYLDPVNFLFLGGMLIAAAMQQWGLHRRLALGIVARIGVSPRRIVLGFMLATGFVTLWISNTATAMMMFPIALAVLKKFEEQHGAEDPLLRRFGLALMLGLAYAASIGGIGTKIGTGTNLVFVKQAGTLLDEELNFFDWLKVGLPIVIVVLPLVWFYLVRIAAPLPAAEFPGGRRAIDDARAGLGPMRRGERIVLVAFVTVAALWIFRRDIDLGRFLIPGWWDLVPWNWTDLLGTAPANLPAPWPNLLADAGDAVVSMTVALALFIIPVESSPRRYALDVTSMRWVSWDLLVLLGGGFAMAYGFQRSGLSAHAAGILQGLGRLDAFTATIALCLLTTLLTEIASNTATATILLPLVAASAPSLGLHPAPLMFAVTLSASFGFMLPAGTPPNAIVFSSGFITVPQMARCGLVVDLGGALLVATACYFLVPWALNLR